MKKHVEHFLIGKKHEDKAKNKVKDPFNYKEKLFLFPSIVLIFFGVMYPFKKINKQQGFLQDLTFLLIKSACNFVLMKIYD